MHTDQRRLVVLGASGTIGRQALQVLGRTESPLEVAACSVHRRNHAADEIRAALPGARTFVTSEEPDRQALLELLRRGDYEVCLNGVVGAAGLPFSEAVVAAGRTLALANKESLVLAGHLLMDRATRTGATVVPVDSEHSAIHQCLGGRPVSEVRRLYLTASGGALRDLPLERLAGVRPEQALEHPNWDMGPRITVDSASMINKAFEVLEAHHLFGVPPASIRVLLHRQSVVHSMVEFVDGTMLAQVGPPDMAFPIHYALHWPARVESPLQGFDPRLFAELTFEEPDPSRYPALGLGWKAAAGGPGAGAVLNAADEVAVEAFLEGDLPFPEIARVCEATLQALPDLPAGSREEIQQADSRARQEARGLLPAVRS